MLKIYKIQKPLVLKIYTSIDTIHSARDRKKNRRIWFETPKTVTSYQKEKNDSNGSTQIWKLWLIQ